MDAKVSILWGLCAVILFAHVSSPAVAITPNLKACEKKVADIMFLLDESGSVKRHNFEVVKRFVIKIVRSLRIGKNNVRVGVFTFSRRVREKFHLNRYFDQKSIVKAIKKIKYHGGSTKTHKALRRLRRSAFSARNGDRIGVQNIAIVITDGRSSRKKLTKLEAAKLKRLGVIMFSIGIGKYLQQSELKAMASEPVSEHKFTVNNYGGLQGIVNKITTTMCEACERTLADIMFLLDESGSVKRHNFEVVKRFVIKIVRSFRIGKNNVRVGVFTFSRRVREKFHLNRYFDLKTMVKAIKKIRYNGGSTKTHKALKRLRRSAFIARNGDRNGVQNIAIVITDGRSSRKKLTKLEAAKLKKLGVVMYSIGIGKYLRQSELKAMASEPISEHKFTVNNFGGLRGIVNKITKPCEVCHNSVADIMFLIDESGSVGKRNFEKVKNFVIKVVRRLKIGRNKVRVGVYTFGTRVRKRFHLKKYFHQRSMNKAIKRIKYRGGSTKTHTGLKSLRRYAFTARNGDRKNVQNFAIVITDGKSSNKRLTILEAAKLKRTNVIMFSIGIGKKLRQSELDAMASQPVSEHKFTVNSFTSLQGIVKKITTKACEDAFHDSDEIPM